MSPLFAPVALLAAPGASGGRRAPVLMEPLARWLDRSLAPQYFTETFSGTAELWAVPAPSAVKYWYRTRQHYVKSVLSAAWSSLILRIGMQMRIGRTIRDLKRAQTLAAGLLLAICAASASADVIFIGSPTCPAPPGCPVFGTEVNGITGNTFTLDQASGQSTDALTDPVLVMVGVPNVGGTFAAPGVTLSVGSGSLGGAAVSGLSWNSTSGWAGTMTSGGPITDAYQALGLSDPATTAGNSESFVNWAAADSAVLGINANNFGVYVYQLDNTGLLGHPSTVNVTFGSALPAGTFVVAYGCDSGTTWSNPCGSGGEIYSTPFTQVGLEMSGSSVPESSTLSLLVCFGGILGLIFRSRGPHLN